MNRLRAKKKVKEGTDEERRDSNEETAKAPTVLKHSKTFRFGRKAPEPEPKEELDLENALPKTDDFRTSLLMSGLSARFSMLREQDDPHSKMGKASDDSVLLPKRQSRLFDFGYSSGGLCDISEVSSIHSSLRPPAPFSLDRSTSAYSLDNEDDGGSVMSRAKPVELGGNNLFGGRQKVYKLPNGGASKAVSGENGEGMGGRVLYDDDVAKSAFQKLREKEKRLQREQKEKDELVDESNTMVRRSSSPDLSSHNHNRETTSTTDSGPSLTRSSTAATSVASFRTPSTKSPTNPLTSTTSSGTTGASLERSNTKRRLYETGLDQHIQSQQFSAMSRLNSISRQRSQETVTPTPNNLSPIPNTFDLPEVQEEEPHREQDARSDKNETTELASGKAQRLTSSTTSYDAPPLSPPLSDADDMSSLPIDPRDRGKATAELVFSKPAQPYDDKQYVQRQLQLHMGHTNPFVLTDVRTNPNQEPNQTKKSNLAISSAFELPKRKKLPLSLHNQPTRTDMQYMDMISPPFSSNDESSIYTEDELMERKRDSVKIMPLQASSGNISAPYHAAKPPDTEHPAIRKRSMDGFETDDMRPSSGDSLSSRKQSSDYQTSPDVSSGLHGMVQHHLRSRSDASSIYDSSSTGFAVQMQFEDRNTTSTNKPTLPDTGFHVFPDPVVSSSPLLRSPRLNEQENTADAVFSDDIYRPGHRRDASTATQKEKDEFHNALAARRRRVQENLKSFIDPDSSANHTSPTIPQLHQAKNPAHLRHQLSKGMLRSIPSTAQSHQDSHYRPGWLPSTGPSNRDGTTTFSTRNMAYHDALLPLQQKPQIVRDVPRPTRSATDSSSLDQARQTRQRGQDRNFVPTHPRRQQDDFNESNDRMRRTRGEPRDSHRDINHPQPFPRNGSQSRTREYDPQTRTQRSQNRSLDRLHSNRVRSPSNNNLRRLDERTVESPVSWDQPSSRPESRATRSRSNSELSGPRSQSRSGKYRDDLARAMAEGTASSAQTTIEELPETRPYVRSPAVPMLDLHKIEPVNVVNNDNKIVGLGVYGEQPALSSPGFKSPRATPMTPSTSNTHSRKSPASSQSSINLSATKSNGEISASRKRPIKKAEISEPTFVSSTARMTTVELSEVAPLQGLNISAPPLPTVNPRRRQTRIQTMFGLPDEDPQPASTARQNDSTETTPPRTGKLRKASSEGGNLRARANAAYEASPAPAMPHSAKTPSIHVQEGGMF